MIGHFICTFHVESRTFHPPDHSHSIPDMPEFCHLHCHTQYSLLDGAARIKNLIGKAKSLEMPAVAITDHGNLFGVPEFYKTAKQQGIKPIIGCEFYIAPSGMKDRTDRTRYHQVLLAKSEEGYKNLIKLSSLSYVEGYYYKPRIDRETLKKYSAGLIATTCCLQGEVLRAIISKGEEAARPIFESYLEIFGEDYYIELQDHGIPEQKQCNEVLLRWAKAYNVKTIVTNDVHYVKQGDSEAQDVLLCLQTGKDLNDPKRMRFENDQFFFKNSQEMQAAFPDLNAKIRDASLDQTREIADKCDLTIPMGKLLMPNYPMPPEYAGDMDRYLHDLVFERAQVRYPNLTDEIRDRLTFELSIIKQMGFAGYFLIVQDFTTAARTLGVSVGPGRGSAAGSAIAFCLGITNIDPLAYNLLFERFLNPERVSMPDIDIDFDDRGRGKVIDYVVQKYGRESVCQIITFGTMGARSVIRDVARVMNIPLSEADRIAKLVPEGPKENLTTAREKVPEFSSLFQSSDANIRKLMEFSTVLEGSARHTGIHAAGVIIAPGNVGEFVPVALAKGKSGEEDIVTTQYEGKYVEDFGLLKMDFLGLKTLTILNDALQLIKLNYDVEIDLDQIPLDDPKTFELFQRGETVAIFQFESSGMREYMKLLKPTDINDLIAMNALYRPGPMDLIPNYIARKHGREPVEYPHPMLEEVLKPTFGIPIYQEQVMQMAQVMGSYTLGGADILRRAMGKKKKEEMDAQRKTFLAGAKLNDVDETTANQVFDMMEKFAGYGFNKSHSAAYSVVAYQTAYLKANYPYAFLAAAMTSEMGDTKKLAVVLEEARHLGLKVLPPSINHSQATFTVEGEAIRFGMAAIKGVGAGAIEAICIERSANGAFTTLYDLVKRVDLRQVNKKTLEGLAASGAMDAFEGHRKQFIAALDDAIKFAHQSQLNRAAGQNSLFGETTETAMELSPQLPFLEAWSRGETLRNERELIGLYVSGHPLDEYGPIVRTFSTASFKDLEKLEPDKEYRFCGIITEVQKRYAKNGKPYAFITLEDFDAAGEITIFSNQFERIGPYLQTDELVMVMAKLEKRERGVSLIAKDMIPMWQAQERFIKSILLRLNPEVIPVEQMHHFKEVCDRNKGGTRLYFDLLNPISGRAIRLKSRLCVIDPSPDVLRTMERIFGPENVVLQGES